MPAPRRNVRTKRDLPNVDAMMRLDRVSAPKQARSLDSLKRIVQAMETLLESKSFSEISLSDIEAESKCGLATIYARFRDKASILAALHESLRDRLIVEIDLLLGPDAWSDNSFNETTVAITAGIVDFYTRNKNLLRASLLLDDKEVYERVAAALRHACGRMQAFVLARSGSKLESALLAERSDLATRAIFSLLQQRLIFQSRPTGQTARDDRKLAEDLALLLQRYVEAK